VAYNLKIYTKLVTKAAYLPHKVHKLMPSLSNKAIYSLTFIAVPIWAAYVLSIAL
jgi:hypothetical protein